MKKVLFNSFKNLNSFIKLFPFILCLYSINAQELPDIVPPAPEAAALSNFTNVPVSHYTGLPNISIPIYTIDKGSVKIPIALSYHARGVQVSEIAPRTGMGWSLQYGGSISRQVRGKADEGPGYAYLNNSQHFMNFSSSLSTRNNVNTIEQQNPDYDFYPDQFTFSAGDVSGKFVLNYVDGEPVIQSYGDVEITYEYSNGQPFTSIGSFIVKDSKGNKYYFGKSKDEQRFARDYQISSGSSVYTDRVVPDQAGASGNAYSSWKLLDVETFSGELISYYYTETSFTYKRKSYDKHESAGNVTNSVGNVNDISKIHARVSDISNFENELYKIVFNQNQDSIVFNAAQSQRQDYDGYALDNISIYHQNELIKKYKLTYNYTTSTDHSNLLWYFDENIFDKYFKRMFLSSIEEEGQNSQKLPPYNFVYNNQVLPSIFSTRQDYWGYYNGASNNGPFNRMFEYGNYTPNRRVDTLKAEAGLLKEITYPTGGRTKFTYEHNKGYLPNSHIFLKIPDINPVAVEEVDLVLRKSDFEYDAGTDQYTNYVLDQLPQNSTITFRFDCMHFSDPYDTNPPPSCLFEFTLNGQPITIGQEFTINSGNSSNSIGVSTVNWSDPDLHRNPDYDFYINISYELPFQGLLYGPGKRIKSIENISNNGVSTFKEFEYGIGGIIGLPSYINTMQDSNGITIDTHYNDASSAYGSFQPNGIGYSDVREYQGTKLNNTGMIEYTFTNISDSGGDYYEFPYHPPTDNEWLRGKNVKTKFYKNLGNGSYGLVREIKNKYLYANNEYTNDYVPAGFYDPLFCFTPEGVELEWSQNVLPFDYQKDKELFRMPLFMQRSTLYNTNKGYRIYHLTGGTQHLLRTEVIDYLGSNQFENITEYKYDYDKHYQVSEVKTSASTGDPTIIKYWYPENVIYTTSLGFDNLASTTPINNLKKNAKHNLSEIIQTATYIDLNTDGIANTNELVSVLRTNYLDYNTHTLPSEVQTLKGIYNSSSNALETRIEYENYNSYGKPIEVKKADGGTLCYLWGYNGQYPIAKIENAEYSDVQTALGFSDTKMENLLESDFAAINNLRSTLSNAMITTYEYAPLRGVTKVTDPRGFSTIYDYDTFNRLKWVVDNDSHLLQEYQYRYKGQN